MAFKDISGRKFGKLTALYRLHNTKGRTKWLCVCDCGNLVETSYDALTNGNKKSCTTKIKGKKLVNERLYNIYRGIKARLYNTHRPRYKDYGGRGIAMCDEWLKYDNFKNWAIANGYNDNLTIDRIDNNGNYNPDNCRWVDMKQQARNRRSNYNYTLNGVTHCLMEWCEIYNIKYKKVYKRLKCGWSIERALELEEK